MRNTPLTDEQLEACRVAPQFETVKPETIFGPNADAILAARVHRENLVRYRQLRQRWLEDLGDVPRSADYYSNL